MPHGARFGSGRAACSKDRLKKIISADSTHHIADSSVFSHVPVTTRKLVRRYRPAMFDDREGLAVTYQPEGSFGIGELLVSARVPPFAGAAVGYFNDTDLRGWAHALQAYPWKSDARLRISASLGDQETVDLVAYVVTNRGQLAVSAHLATVDIDDHSPTVGTVTEARVLIPTSYQAIGTFARALASAIADGGGTARLNVDRLE
ncbi:hypothetical protein [Nocardia pseudobrasiliensis]|nr:hypothetical protein [Nocardia pseudobrasiliensis]